MARVLRSIGMPLKILFIFLLIALVSCSSKNSNLTQSWKVDGYRATAYCDMGFDSIEEEEKNLIIETPLGFNDSFATETGFNLYENGEYQFLKKTSLFSMAPGPFKIKVDYCWCQITST